MLTRNITRWTGNDEILERLAITPELLVVCDFEGTLTDLDHCGFRPVEGSMRLLSDLASLPQTSVAIISHGSVASLRTAGRDTMDHRVTVIEPCTNIGPDDRAKAGTPPVAPRKELAIDGLLAQQSPSLIFFAGDDESDEAVFTALGIDDIGCKIGHGPTSATMQMDNPVALITFLDCVLQRRRSLTKAGRRTTERDRTIRV